MLYLDYDPIEIPSRIRIFSKGLDLDLDYEPSKFNSQLLCYIDDLYKLASTGLFESISVYLTSHNSAYCVNGKDGSVTPVCDSWVDLCKIKKITKKISLQRSLFLSLQRRNDL